MSLNKKSGRVKRKEKKDAPLPILLKPSIKNQFFKICYVKDQSMNETVNELILSFIKKNKSTIKEFDKTYRDISCLQGEEINQDD